MNDTKNKSKLVSGFLTHREIGVKDTMLKRVEVEILESKNADLRQQLADVSHERDLLRELLVRVIDSGALSNERFEDIESEACSIVSLRHKPSAEEKS